MGFIGVMLLIWAVAMAAWFVVSKYFKSSDIDRIKARLAGTTKAKASKKAKADPAQASVIHGDAVVKNRVAQMLVDKYKLGPKLHSFLEQAGLHWQPARFVHLTRLRAVSRSVGSSLRSRTRPQWSQVWRPPRFRSCTSASNEKRG
jgi:hypothetical protein